MSIPKSYLKILLRHGKGRQGELRPLPSHELPEKEIESEMTFGSCTFLVTFLACPKKGDPKKGTRRKFFSGMLGRPRYISETCPSGFGHPKCLTLVLGRLPGIFAWGKSIS